MHADRCTGVSAGKRTGRGAAVPEGDGVFLFVQRNRVAEEDRFAGELHADPHGKGAVDIGLACGGNALIVQQAQHRADGGTEGGEEIRPAARGKGPDVVRADIVGIGLVQTGVVVPVLSGVAERPQTARSVRERYSAHSSSV